MYNTPKYLHSLICMAVGGCLLASCTSDMPDKIDDGKGAEVTFSVADESRAVTTATLDRFAVYGDMKFIEKASPTPVVIFNKTEVVKTDDGWQYQGTQYWYPSHEHSFVAVHPLSVLDAAQYEASELTFTYTLPESNDDVADIIAATHRRLYSGSDDNTTIVFQFAHLLSQINFFLEPEESSTGDSDVFKFHKLEMSGFGTTAAITIKPASRQSNSLQTDDSEIAITTSPGSGRLETNFTEPKEVSDDGLLTTLIMLPQTFSASEKVEISLTYSVNDEMETTKVSATLSGFKWETGKNYNYKFKLDVGRGILVISNSGITDWDPVNDFGQIETI